MDIKGKYFVNVDLNNLRAHSNQIQSTVKAISDNGVEIEIVAPNYKSEGQEIRNVKKIGRFGDLKPGRLSFLIFTLYSISYLFSIFRKVDFIYFRSDYFLPTVFVAKILGFKIFYELHRRGVTAKEKFARWCLVKIANGVIVINKDLKKYFQKHNSKIIVAHDAVDLRVFDFSNAQEEKGGEKIVLYVGSIKKIKGADVLIAAAKKLPQYKFILLGNVYDGLEKNLPENVQMPGSVLNKEVPRFISRSDVLVIPHPNNEYSQSPMKVFEYMASGKPIISSNLTYLREVLDEGFAMYFKEGDSEELSKTIEEFFSKQDEYSERSKINIDAVRMFTWEKRGLEIANFLNKNV